MRRFLSIVLLFFVLICPAFASVGSVPQGGQGTVAVALYSSPLTGSTVFQVWDASGAVVASGSPVQNNGSLPANAWGATVQSGGYVGVSAPQSAPTGNYTVIYSDTTNGQWRGSFSVTYTVPPVALAGFSIAPSQIPEGSTATGTVTLNQVVSVNTQVAISLVSGSGPSQTSWSSSVTVPAASSSANFTITSFYNQSDTVATSLTLRASSGGSSYTAALSISPPAPASSSGTPQNLTTWNSNGDVSNGPHWVFDPNNPFTASAVGRYLTIASGSSLTPGTYKVDDFSGAFGTQSQGTQYMIHLTANVGPPGASGGQYTLSAAAPVQPPGASLMVAPVAITAGSNATLTWSTSGATTIAVTGQTAPAASGSVTVNPTQTTTYTITATNSAGNTVQTATLTVNQPASSSGGCFGSAAGCGDGSSTFDPATGLAGSSSPGDLKIGIPGIGSISFPSGWWTQIITYALTAVNLTGTFLVAGMDAAAALTIVAINTGFSATQGVITTVGTDIKTGITDTATATQGVINTGTSRIIGTSTFLEKLVVTDMQNMLQGLFIPDPSSLEQFKTEEMQFLDWGPYHFVTAFQNVLTSPASDGSVGGLPGLSFPAMSVNPSASAQLVPTSGAAGGINGVAYAAPYSWYSTGQTIAFNTSQVTNLPGWAFLRLIMGGVVWLLWGFGLVSYLMPKQVF